MQPEYHLIASGALGAAYYFFTGSIEGSAAAFLSGFLIDVDHFLDYWIFRRKIVIDKGFFMHPCKESGKLYVFFHSVELLWAIWFAAAITGSQILQGLGFGIGVHLLMDIIGNPVNPYSYFLFYRALKGFSTDKMWDKEKEQTVRFSIFRKLFK